MSSLLTSRVVRRRAWSIISLPILLFLVTVATFLMLSLMPGDPVDGLLPSGATDEMRDEIRSEYGLDLPLAQRYLNWMTGVLSGDLGVSLQSRQPVATLILERAPVSLELAFWAILVALVIAVPVGIYTAYRPNGALDRLTSAGSSALLAIPSFVLGVLLLFVFALQLRLLPMGGWVPFSEDPIGHFRALILPVLTLAAGECVLFIRILKGDMIATLKQDHVLSGRARGLPTWRILLRHSFRQSSFSLVTVLGLSIGRLIGGAIIVETIFSLPGLGSFVVAAVTARDFMVVQAVVLLSAVLYLLVNTAVDLIYPLLDPRVRKA